MELREKIISDFKEYNEDANSRWENEKILELCNYKEDGEVTTLTISIGKWDKTFHDLEVTEEGIELKSESQPNSLLEDVVHYILNPIFFPTK